MLQSLRQPVKGEGVKEMDIVLQALPYVLNLISGIILAACTSTLNKTRKERADQRKAEAEKEQAVSDGVQALLRESIVSAYNKYSDRGYCPIYAKESIKKAYKSYAALGGNDVAKELYHKILAMPEAIPEERSEQ